MIKVIFQLWIHALIVVSPTRSACVGWNGVEMQWARNTNEVEIQMKSKYKGISKDKIIQKRCENKLNERVKKGGQNIREEKANIQVKIRSK